MKMAAERDDASEKNGAMENKVVPIRALAGLAVNGDGQRPELAEAKTYLAQN